MTNVVMPQINEGIAREIIAKLKAGTTPLDYSSYLNVGNEDWCKGAEELYEQIESDRTSMVRFIKGYYGEGKTHLMGILRSMAFSRQWAVSYINAENIPLNKFDEVYGQVIRNIILPPGFPVAKWLPGAGEKGAQGVLSAFFTRQYVQVHDSADKQGIYKMGVVSGVKEKVDKIVTTQAIDILFGNAVKGFVDSSLGEKANIAKEVVAWLEAADVKLPQFGIKKKITKTTARDMMRSLSKIAVEAGLNGILILIDEAERIMHQTTRTRQMSYEVIRNLLDNADGQAGMSAAKIYIAATPEMFDSAKGFPEYDALRSRLESSSLSNLGDYFDRRGVVMDLRKTALNREAYKQLVKKVRDIHSIARGWKAQDVFDDKAIEHLLSVYDDKGAGKMKPRQIASHVAVVLEIMEQNRNREATELISSTYSDIAKMKAPQIKEWN